MALAQGSNTLFTDPAIQDFLTWKDQVSCPGIVFAAESRRDCTFVPDKAIERYFSYKRESERSKLRRLVGAATRHAAVAVVPESIAQRCPKVFAILVEIGQPHFISSFVHHKKLWDNRLPFGSNEAASFPKLEGGATFFDQFYAYQWQYCAEKMSHSLDTMELDNDVILPIIDIEKLGGGASAVVHKIRVHEEYDDLELTWGDERADHHKTSSHEPHVYVIKSYHRIDAEKYFNAEVDGFRKLNETGRAVPNLIDFYGSFQQNRSFNIILEYANVGTLEQYFEKVKPPKLGHDIVTLWSNIFGLNSALASIHAIEQGDDDGAPRILQGWHQDIKPENVLVIGDIRSKPYDVHFMLADLGLSHFTAVVEEKAGLTGEDTGGTRAYSAPERNLARGSISNLSHKVKQDIDTWSLGCVYSEVAVWVVDGTDGLDKYREERQVEAESYGLSHGGCFHDDKAKLLRTVSETHKRLKTTRVLQDIVNDMLWKHLLQYMFAPSGVRLTANQLLSFSEELINSVREKLSQPRGSSPRPPSRRSTAPPGFEPEPAVNLSTDPPKTPPQIPPEYQTQNRQHLTEYFESHSTTPTHSKPSMPSVPGDDRQPVAVSQSPDSFHGGSSPPPVFDPIANSLRDSSSSVGGQSSERPWSPDAAKYTLAPESRAAFGAASEQTLSEVHGGTSSQQVWTNSTEDSFSNTAADFQPSFSRSTTIPVRTQQDHNKFQVDSGMAGHGHNPSNASSIGQPGPASQETWTATNSKRKGRAVENPPRKPQKVMTVEQLKTWADLTRANSGFFSGPEQFLPFEKELIGELKKRDHIFVIDDAESMQPHWPKLLLLYKNLIYMIKKKELDPNGSELHFIISDQHLEAKHTTGQVTLVTNTGRYLHGDSNLAARLDDILKKYEDKLKEKPKKTRPISLYIMTDGIWQTGPRCLETVAAPIERMIKTLEELGAKAVQVGIQFIRFGNDATGMERLRWLDASLKGAWNLKRDICDTTSADGNVWKMLLGSINNYWDDDPDD